MLQDDKQIVLNDEQIVERLKQWIEDSDTDDLACIAGEVFGGECFFREGKYTFEPNMCYYGAFDNILYRGSALHMQLLEQEFYENSEERIVVTYTQYTFSLLEPQNNITLEGICDVEVLEKDVSYSYISKIEIESITYPEDYTDSQIKEYEVHISTILKDICKMLCEKHSWEMSEPCECWFQGDFICSLNEEDECR